MSIEHEERDPHVIGQYESGLKNSVVEIRGLKIKNVKDEHVVLTTNNCSSFSTKFSSKCERNVSDIWFQYCNSFTPFTEQ